MSDKFRHWLWVIGTAIVWLIMAALLVVVVNAGTESIDFVTNVTTNSTHLTIETGDQIRIFNITSPVSNATSSFTSTLIVNLSDGFCPRVNCEVHNNATFNCPTLPAIPACPPAPACPSVNLTCPSITPETINEVKATTSDFDIFNNWIVWLIIAIIIWWLFKDKIMDYINRDKQPPKKQNQYPTYGSDF